MSKSCPAGNRPANGVGAYLADRLDKLEEKVDATHDTQVMMAARLEVMEVTAGRRAKRWAAVTAAAVSASVTALLALIARKLGF